MNGLMEAQTCRPVFADAGVGCLGDEGGKVALIDPKIVNGCLYVDERGL